MTPQDLVSLLQQRGLSPAASAGVAGNLMQESSLNPAAVGDGGTSLGLAQWHNERRQGLLDFAKGAGASPTDAGTQVDYLFKELSSPAYSGVMSGLKSAQTPEDAAKAFLGFERPAGWSAENPMAASGAANRVRNAAAVFSGGRQQGPANIANVSLSSQPTPSTGAANAPDDSGILARLTRAPAPAPVQDQQQPQGGGLLAALQQQDQQAQSQAHGLLQQMLAQAAPDPTQAPAGMRGIPSILGQRTAS